MNNRAATELERLIEDLEAKILSGENNLRLEAQQRLSTFVFSIPTHTWAQLVNGNSPSADTAYAARLQSTPGIIHNQAQAALSSAIARCEKTFGDACGFPPWSVIQAAPKYAKEVFLHNLQASETPSQVQTSILFFQKRWMVSGRIFMAYGREPNAKKLQRTVSFYKKNLASVTTYGELSPLQKIAFYLAWIQTYAPRNPPPFQKFCRYLVLKENLRTLARDLTAPPEPVASE